MPVTNQNQEQAPFAKYSVFISDSYGGTYKLNKRCIIQNFRTQLRGLGSAGITILPKNQINEQLTDTIKEGQFIKILDTTQYFETEYNSVGKELFFGTISSVTVDTYEGKDDDRGYAQVDEIGHYYNRKPIIWASKPQVFNPIVSGTAYGNKKVDELQFETLLDNMTKAELSGDENGKFPNTGSSGKTENKKVWSLESYLRYMAENNNIDIKFPWEFDNDIIEAKADKQLEGLDPNNPIDARRIAEINANTQTDKQLVEYQYRAFKDTLEIRSYDHFDGKSFQELLSSVLDEPFDWYFSAVSTNYPTIQIINKSPILAIDLCPAAQAVTKILDAETTTNFNITKQDEVYDRIIYRGDNILIAGTLSHWNNNGSASMEKGWTNQEEQDYVTPPDVAIYDEETNKALVATYRAKDKKVYQQYKYRHIAESCPIQLAKKYDEKKKKFTQAPLLPDGDGQAQYEMNPFFPRIDFVKYENNSTYVLDKPVVYTSTGTHKTPPLLEIKWADTLPWKVDGQKETRKPFIVAQGFSKDSDDIARFFTWDMTKAGGGYDTCNFKHTVDGYKLEIGLPETLAYVDDDQLIFTLGNTIVDSSSDYWDDTKLSDRNPQNTPYKFMTNWKLMAATVAGFSDQRLEWTIDNPNTTQRNKIKILEDRSLQCWMAHAGTIKEVRNGNYDVVAEGSLPRNYSNGYDRFQKDTFIRNDFKKLYDLARHSSNWLFTPKASAKVELALMKYTYGWSLGEMIGYIVDKTIKRKINTVVASIEYDCVANRVYVSTSIPEMPILKKMQQAPLSRSVTSPTSDSKEATIETKQEKVIVKQDYPTHGYVSGAGGVASVAESKVNIYQVMEGTELSPVPVVGIKKVNTELPASVDFIGPLSAPIPDTLVDGMGIATNVQSSEAVLVWNGLESIISSDLAINDRLVAYTTKSAAYYDQTEDVSGSYKFYIPSFRV
jgi:hypothetical protein